MDSMKEIFRWLYDSLFLGGWARNWPFGHYYSLPQEGDKLGQMLFNISKIIGWLSSFLVFIWVFMSLAYYKTWINFMGHVLFYCVSLGIVLGTVYYIYLKKWWMVLYIIACTVFMLYVLFYWGIPLLSGL